MKAFILGLLFGLIMMAGCSRKTVPVSSHTETESDIDSTYSLTADHIDSVYYKETLEEKTLPGAVVGITLEKKQLDSLITALGNLPSAVNRTVYYKDPGTRAILSIMLDSLQKIRIECEATEQKYYQTTIQQSRTIKQLTTELQSVKEENTRLRSEVVMEKTPWWQSAWTKIKSFGFGVFFVVFIIAVVLLGLFIKK